MKNLFAPYELAVKLNELGFNEPCLAYYETEATLNLFDTIYGSITYPAEKEGLAIDTPLWQQVIDWLRNKQIYIEIIFSESLQRYFCNIKMRKVNDLTILSPGYNYPENDINEGYYYEALSKAIEEAIKLIKL